VLPAVENFYLEVRSGWRFHNTFQSPTG